MMYTDVMVDLETIGTAPGSGIIAIGAVKFGRGMPESDWKLFEVPVISVQSNYYIGLTSDKSTWNWWQRQDVAARTVFEAAQIGGDDIKWAMIEFGATFPADALLWGNGADFDNVLLGCAYKAAGLSQPWGYQANRCFRTMRKESGCAEPPFQGTRHNALADALHQTRWLQAIWSNK